MTCIGAALVVVVLLAGASSPAAAQDPVPPPVDQERPRERPEDVAPDEPQDPVDNTGPPARRRAPAVTFRLSGLVGFQSFTASDSFNAVLGTSSGVVFGGGAGVLVGRNLFVDVQVSRFRADGSRVFIGEGGQQFDLGIPTTVTVTPIDISAGWRLVGTPRPGRTGKPQWRPVPYAGAGVGFQTYTETSEFADADDDVDESHGSYHVLGGVELPVSRHLGATVDVLYRWVPDAIGSSGVSEHFEEDDLGGAQIRFRVVYTF